MSESSLLMSESPEHLLQQKELHEFAREIGENCPAFHGDFKDRNQKIFRDRFFDEKTLKEIGNNNNLAKARIMQIERKGLRETRFMKRKEYEQYE
jgi:DNA-directed RNA polymerase sigma subunit (sigma70/sigma32)